MPLEVVDVAHMQVWRTSRLGRGRPALSKTHPSSSLASSVKDARRPAVLRCMLNTRSDPACPPSTSQPPKAISDEAAESQNRAGETGSARPVQNSISGISNDVQPAQLAERGQPAAREQAAATALSSQSSPNTFFQGYSGPYTAQYPPAQAYSPSAPGFPTFQASAYPPATSAASLQQQQRLPPIEPASPYNIASYNQVPLYPYPQPGAYGHTYPPGSPVPYHYHHRHQAQKVYHPPPTSYQHYCSQTQSLAQQPPPAPYGSHPPNHPDSSHEIPNYSWEQFCRNWYSFLESDELLLIHKARTGQVAGYTARRMTDAPPTWNDCEALAAGLRQSGYRVTVERLKQIIRGLNLLPGAIQVAGHLKIAGAKNDLLTRVIDCLRKLQTARHEDYFRAARIIGEAQGFQYPAMTNGSANPVNSQHGYAGTSNYAHANGTSASTSNAVTYPSRAQDFGAATPRSPQRPSYTAAQHTNGYHPNGRYQPVPQAIRPIPPSASSSAAHNQQIPTQWPTRLPPAGQMALASQPAIPINFKPSPFYRLVQAVSTVVTVHRSQGERQTAIAHVHLNEDQRAKLLKAREDKTAPQFQLRLFCTSEDHYRPGATYGHYAMTNRTGVPIEFPSACEAKVNDANVPGNLKGIKKKVGSAPPANVSAAKAGKNSAEFALRLDANSNNRVDLHYVNTEKQYYLVVYLVEATSVAQVVERTKTKKRTSEDVIKALQKHNMDEDVQAGSSSMSLRDPLVYTPLVTPVRSINCAHLQCFDATIFLTMMETTPSWMCPVCNRPISADELVYDCFVQEIKEAVPSSVDTVVVETDGTWRTEDNKYGNASQVAEAKAKKDEPAHPITDSLDSEGTPFEAKPNLSHLMDDAATDSASAPGSNRGSTAPKSRNAKSAAPTEIIDLDDDTDEEDYSAFRGPRGASSLAGLSMSSSTSASGAGPSGHSSMWSSLPPPSGTAGSRLGPSPFPSRPAASRTGGAVIDLTASDEEDDAGPAPYRGSVNGSAAQKRRADSDWEDQGGQQRSRTDGEP